MSRNHQEPRSPLTGVHLRVRAHTHEGELGPGEWLMRSTETSRERA